MYYSSSIMKAVGLERKTDNASATNGQADDSATSVSSSIDPTAVTFVDYRRPPAAKVLPLSKYKLWLLVELLVYLAVWVSEGANLTEAIRYGGWLSPDGAQFVVLAITVFVLTFAALDVVVFVGTFKIRGKEYGLGPWMKCGARIQWFHKTQYADYFVVECLMGAIHILEEGFGMFNATSKASINATRSLARAIQVSDQLKNKTSRDGTLHTDDHTSNDEQKDNAIAESQHSDDDDDDVRLYKCSSGTCKTIVKIVHRISPDKMPEYLQWQNRIQRAAKLAPGLIDLQSMDIVPEETNESAERVGADTGSQPNKLSNDNGDIEVGQGKVDDNKDQIHSTNCIPEKIRRLPTFRHAQTSGYSTRATNLHTVFMTFDNIDSLNDWMLSPRRKALMKQLEPLLAVPDQEWIQAERVASARDAFTNLTIQQGQSTPTLPPKKWKVWWLTTLALVITIRWVTLLLAYYLEFWGLDKAHPRLRALVTTFVATFLNSYVMTPFLLFLFQPWMIRHPNEFDERFIWKSLEDGIHSIWLKFLLTFVFYGGCVIAWLIQTY